MCLAAKDQIQSIAARSTNSSETHCSGCKGSLEIYLVGILLPSETPSLIDTKLLVGVFYGVGRIQ